MLAHRPVFLGSELPQAGYAQMQRQVMALTAGQPSVRCQLVFQENRHSRRNNAWF